jgi:hypothetical protein
MSDLEAQRGRQPIVSTPGSCGRCASLTLPQVSTGRGGAGNIIRSPSQGVDPDSVPGVERGRELSPMPNGDHVSLGLLSLDKSDAARRSRTPAEEALVIFALPLEIGTHSQRPKKKLFKNV